MTMRLYQTKANDGMKVGVGKAEVKWIKIVTDIFNNRKIKQIETMPDADSILVIWFKLSPCRQ